MNDYYSYHPQPHPQMAPFLSQPPNFYMRPQPFPQTFKRRLRKFFGQLIGFTIIALAIITLFLNSPDKYLTGVEIPLEVITPTPFRELFSDKLKSPPPPNDEMMPPEEIELEMTPPKEVPPMIEPIIERNMRLVKGSYIVQLASVRDIDVAKKYYYNVRNNNNNLFEAVSPAIQKTNLRQRGTFYRLYVFPFISKNEASDFCYQLKVKGWDCFVRRR